MLCPSFLGLCHVPKQHPNPNCQLGDNHPHVFPQKLTWRSTEKEADQFAIWGWVKTLVPSEPQNSW